MKHKTFFKKTQSMAVMTSLSRFFGFIRTVLIARFFGTGAVADAFLIAFKIPNLMRRLFAEGAMSGGFIPLFSEIQDKASKQIFVSRMIGFFILIIGLFCITGILFSKNIIDFYYMFFSESGGEKALASLLLKLMFPYLLFISLAALAQGVLNCYDNFKIPAFSAVLFNIVVIISVMIFVFFKPESSSDKRAVVFGLAVSVAGLVQFFFQVPYILKNGIKMIPAWPQFSSKIRQFFKLMAPVLFSAGIYPLNHVINDILVLSLGTGAVSSLYYSIRIQELPLGIIVVSISTVCLPLFAAHRVNGDNQRMRFDLEKTWLMLSAFLIPVIVFSLIEKTSIFTLLFYGGRFGMDAVNMTTACFTYHISAIFFIGLSRVKTSLFFSLKDTRTPLMITVIVFVLNITGVFLVTRIFQKPVYYVAAVSFISAFAGAFLNTFFFFKKTGLSLPVDFYKNFLYLSLGISVSTAVLFFLKDYISPEKLSSFFFNTNPHNFYTGRFVKESAWVFKMSTALSLFLRGLIFAGLYYLFLFKSGILKKITQN